MNVQFEERDIFLIARARMDVLEVGNARSFRDAIAGAVGERKRLLILDLSTLEEVDSAGLGALVAILKWVRRFGGSMSLCGLQGAAREVLELTMLHHILPLHGSVEEAIEEQKQALRTE